jgi:DNA-binding NarL/FixJ family response regulator
MAANKETGKIKVLIADDHPVVQEGLALMLKGSSDVTVVAFAGNGPDAIAKAKKLLPEVVILDVMMPDSDAPETVKQLLALKNAPAILCCSSVTEGNRITALINAGIRGYVLKSTTADEIQQAVRKLANGEKYFTPAVADIIVEAMQDSSKDKEAAFSAKETEIIKLICKKKSAKEIAAMMEMNIRTLESAKAKIMSKMNVKNVAGLVNYALKNKVVSLSDLE